VKSAEKALPVLSEAIRQVRFDLGLTRFAFARRLDCSVAEIDGIEEGGISPALFPLLKIGEWACPGPAKTAIVEELRARLRAYPLLKVVA
jgi:transcriptional regulator with XRE-family HTH domain